jgi:class 3 adenylate cyclase/tetratricopeptide (TPR) repeat protein
VQCPSCGNRNRPGAKFCDSCGAPLEAAEDAAPREPPSDVPESFVGGRYRVRRFLGERARKRVYLARDTTGDRDVALAVFETEGVEETVLATSRREVQAMRQLGEHPHLVSVLDTGEEDGRPYIASRYMPGGDVETVLDDAEDRRLPVDRALAIAADVSRALEHAHARGIVHRDLKPATVWLAEDGAAQLGDFGLAATDQRSQASMEGMLVGTVAYLPPEQALGRASDPRADLYSLGALLYEMLTGQPPFPGDDAVAIISQHLNATPVPPSSRDAPGVSPALDELVLRLLAKSPDERPESARAVRRELEAVASAPAGAEEEHAEAEENPLDRLAGGVFVGREAELEQLREALNGTLAGRGGLLLLVGEPGIGKTRTAEELATYARVRGANVQWGRSHEGEGAPAYWPWAQAIRSYVRESDPVALAWELGQGAGDVAHLVPEVRERVGDVPDAPALDSDEARFRLFDSIATFLVSASRSRPLVVILDDLHWADEPSLLLLKFVARQASDSGLLVVGTYRDVELGRHHPLARTLAELAEIQGSRRVPLRGLDTEAVERFIEMTAGIEPRPGLAAAVHDQTEGNPFFVTEVVRLMASEGSLAGPVRGGWELAIPQGVREVVGRRLDRLSEEANEVLTLAAAVGREFNLDVLEGLNGEPREELVDAIEQAIESQVVSEAPHAQGGYCFSHALVRETLYAELTEPRRVELHRRIGESLERIFEADPDPPVAELAHHFIVAAPAGEADKAIAYAERAARRASDQLAHEEAATHYERALEVLDFAPGSDPARRLALLLELGEAQRRAGQFVPGRETFEAAVATARELGDSDSLAQAALGMSALSEVGRLDEAIVEVIEESLAALGDEDSVTRVELLGGLSQELVWRDPQGEAAPLTREAVAIARRLGDPRTLAAALAREMFLMVATPEAMRQRLRNTDEMLELAERAGDRELAVRGHVYRMLALLDVGDVAGADLELDTYSRLAEDLRMPQHLWHVPLLRGMRASMDGRFADAERLADEARRGGERAQEPLSAQLYALQMSVLRRHQGRVEEMIPAVREMAQRYPAIRAWRLALVSFLADAGRLEETRTEFERLAAHDFDDIPLDAQWLTAMTRIADACAHLGDAQRAALLYEKLAPFADYAVVAGRAASMNGPVSSYLGRLAMTIGRIDDAIRHLEHGLELGRRMGDRPFATEAAHYLAAALLERGATGDRERALELLARCLDAAQEMGMRLVIERALALRLEAQGLATVDVTTSIDTVISAVESERPDIRSFAAPDGTVTILFSDIENSTLMTERLGDERWIDVLRAHNAVFREHVRGHGGYEVKNQGDGFMLVFSDPRKALECAVAIQSALAELEVAESERIRVRMGLHTGEAIREEGDFFGRSVILAARIAAQAAGGEILVSSVLKERCNDGELSFEAGRDVELKGLAGTHEVFSARWEPEPAEAG